MGIRHRPSIGKHLDADVIADAADRDVDYEPMDLRIDRCGFVNQCEGSGACYLDPGIVQRDMQVPTEALVILERVPEHLYARMQRDLPILEEPKQVVVWRR